MTRLVLFRAIASPPARSVMMLGDLLGLQFEYRDVKLLKMEHKSDEYKKNINPMGTVPVLQDGDFMLSESHAILKYLTERYGGALRPRLYPAEARARARVDERMYFNAGYFFPRMADIVIPLIMRGSTERSPRQTQNIEEAYGVVEAYLRQARFVAGEALTLADLSAGATAAAAHLVHGLDHDRYPRFAEWMKELQEMPCFKNINAEGVAYMAKLIAKAKEISKMKSQ